MSAARGAFGERIEREAHAALSAALQQMAEGYVRSGRVTPEVQAQLRALVARWIQAAAGAGGGGAGRAGGRKRGR